MSVSGPRAPRATRPSGKSASPTTPDPLEIAMEAVAKGQAPEGVAQRLLARQEQLVGWQIAGERAGVLLKLLTAFAGAALAAVVAWMAWIAHNDRSLTISAFRTPPALEAQGLGGVALAGRLQDELHRMQQETHDYEEPVSVRNADSAVKVDIPATNISLTDLRRLLADIFGNQTPVSGDVFTVTDPQAPQALGISIRVGDAPGVRLVQADGDVEALIRPLTS